VDEASLHVTLCFLGWRSTGEIDGIAAACADLAGTGDATLRTHEGLWLPRRRPRVLAVGLEDGGGRLAGAQAQLSAALAGQGWYQPEDRAFLAHVTVARVRRDARIRAVALPEVPARSFQGTRVVLYESRLGAGGARYHARASVDLTRRP
jgi:2'-5' RNA ligase